jgi:predicted nuclease with TOPRIM domain
MKKKYEGGEMHKAMKAKYGDKADEVFYGKLTKMAMGESVEMNEDKEELGKISKELAGASKMHKGQSDRVKKIADKIDEAKDEEEHTNLIMQLRKAISLRGNKVTFADEKSVVVSDKDAQKFMSMFSKLKKPAEKEMLMKSAAKSHKHFKMALSGRVEKPKSGGLDLPKMKSEK